MRSRIILLLFIASMVLIFLMPSESNLGESYKLIYFHVPVTVITIISLLMFPILHLRINSLDVKTLSISTAVFSVAHLIISSIFMLLAWGGLIFSEVRFVFSVTLFLFAVTHSLLCFIDMKLARVYSFLVYLMVPYFYLQLTRAEFQLHPTVVQMPAMLYIPYLFSFPFVFLFYLVISKKMRGSIVS